MSKPNSSKIDMTELFLLKGKMPELKKLNKEGLLKECGMWRALWQWTPSEVKYYLARTGQQIGVTQRNYKRYVGWLQETHWVLEEIEIAVQDKQYDTVSGQTYYETKVIRMKLGGVMDIQWIKERLTEEELLAQQAETDVKTTKETVAEPEAME